MSQNRDNIDEGTPTEVPMKAEEMARILRKIDRALFGDRYNQSERPGFLAIMEELHKDYYGDKKTGRTGTKEMVLKLWDNNRKMAGAVVVLGLASSFIGWVIEQWLVKKP